MNNVTVCKKVFLATLTYSPNNDSYILANVKCIMRNSAIDDLFPPQSFRGRPNVSKSLDKSTIRDHIESYQPCISHYRREHAPLTRYLPSEITGSDMLKDYLQTPNHIPCSYETYRIVVKSMQISIAKLEEQCEVCVAHAAAHKAREECDRCASFKEHLEQAKQARAL